MLRVEGEGCQGGGPGEVRGDSQLDGHALVGQLPGRGVYSAIYFCNIVQIQYKHH